MNVWTGGTFSLIHPGHAHLFRECQRIAQSDGAPWAGRVTAAVNSDAFVERYKGEHPVQTLAQRSEMVAAMRWVNQVQVNDGTDQPELILAAHTDVIVIGDDWAPPRDYHAQLQITQRWLDHYRIGIVYVPRVGGLSTTQLKALVRSGA